MRRAENLFASSLFSELFPTLFPSPGTPSNHAEGSLSLRIGNDRRIAVAPIGDDRRRLTEVARNLDRSHTGIGREVALRPAQRLRRQFHSPRALLDEKTRE